MLGVLYQKIAKFILRIRVDYSNEYRLYILAEIRSYYIDGAYYLNSFINLN